MADKMICPVCGKQFDSINYQCLDNGNPACPECVSAEQREDEEEKHDK